jgi:hypothetical protein
MLPLNETGQSALWAISAHFFEPRTSLLYYLSRAPSLLFIFLFFTFAQAALKLKIPLPLPPK